MRIYWIIRGNKVQKKQSNIILGEIMSHVDFITSTLNVKYFTKVSSNYRLMLEHLTVYFHQSPAL